MTTCAAVLVACGIFVVVCIRIGIVQGDVDCKHRPNVSDFADCCKIPEPKWEAYSEQYFKGLTPKLRHLNPCAISCVYNVTNSLQGETFNMDNARAMLTTLFPEHQDFQQLFALGLEKCSPEIARTVANFKAKENSRLKKPGQLDCSPLGWMFAMCSHKYVFVTCPATAWNSSDTCQRAKEYAMHCIAEMGRRGPGSGRGNRKFDRSVSGGRNNGKGQGIYSTKYI